MVQDDRAQGYEFSEEENVELGNLSRVMIFVARFQVVLGVVLLAASGLTAVESSWGVFLALVSQGLLNVVVGIWVTRAGDSFREVVDTEGRDIPLLMGALRQLRKVFNLQQIMILAALLFAAAAVAVIAFPALNDAEPSLKDGARGAPATAPDPPPE